MAAKAPREAGIELGRIYCCFCVILIHLTAFFPAFPAVSAIWSLAKCASTPVFFLIAGFFFAPEKPFRLYMTRLAARVIAPMIIIMLLIAQLTPWLSGQDTLGSCLTGLNTENILLAGRILITTWPYDYLPNYNPFLSLWFSFALLLCYLCFPVLKMICSDSPRCRSLKIYLLWMGGFFFVFRVTLLCFFPDSFTVQHLDWWIEEKPFYWLWLMMLGHELARHFKKPGFWEKHRARLLPASLAAYIGGGFILYILTMKYNVDEQGLVNQRYFVREFIFYILAQLGMFVFFCSLSPGRGFLSKVILFTADKTFYIYITHEAIYYKLQFLTGRDMTGVSNYLSLGILTFLTALVLGTVFKKLEKSLARLLSGLWSKRAAGRAALKEKETAGPGCGA
jgi:surface polysaccharide O-acyltransferase-like enzyme